MTDLEKFLSKISITSSCWLWKGKVKTNGGYARFCHGGVCTPAHRYAYELWVGPILDGLQIDHLCRVRHCVNPDHLEPVTLAENVLRGVGLSAQNLCKRVCKRGHPLTGDNLRIRVNGARCCRECLRMLNVKYNHLPDRQRYRREWNRQKYAKEHARNV